MGVANDLDLRRPIEPELRPVGTLALNTQGTATLLRKIQSADDLDRWEYGDELPVEVRFNQLERAAVPGTVDEVFWAGMEVRIKKRVLEERGLVGLPNLFVTAALRPLSLAWFVEGRLRPGCESREDRQQAVRRLARGETTLGELPFDPFSANPDEYVARLGDPLRPNWQDGEWFVQRGVWRETSSRKPECKAREGDEQPTRCWYFSVCPETPDRVVKAMAATKACSTLVEEHERQRVRRGRGLTDTGAQTAGSGIAGRVDYSERQVMEHERLEVRPAGAMAERIMEAAIRQAMAGRCEGGASMEKWIAWHFHNLYSDMAGRLDRAPRVEEAEFPEEVEVFESLGIRLARFREEHRRECACCWMLPKVGTMDGVREVLRNPGGYLPGCVGALVAALEG